MSTDIHYLGTFNSILDAWKLFPNGGGYGDYITINGETIYWIEETRSWGPKTNTGGSGTPAETIQHGIDVKGDGKFRDGVTVGEYVPETTGGAIDKHGNADFRTAKIESLFVKYDGELIPLSEYIKIFKTELPPDWQEYNKPTLFDSLRFLIFDPNEPGTKYYTTFKGIKDAILAGVDTSGGSGGGGTIQIIRTDSQGIAPSDTNVFSASETLQRITNAINEAIPEPIWHIDDNGNVYCNENVYSMKGLSAYGAPGSDEEYELNVLLQIVSDAVAQLTVDDITVLLSRQGHKHTIADITDLLTNFYTKTQIGTLLSEFEGGGGSSVQMEDYSATFISLTVDGLQRYIARSNHNHNIFALEGINPSIEFTEGYVLTWNATTLKLELRAPTGGGGTSASWGVTNNNQSPLTVDGVSKIVSLSGHTHAISNITNLQSTLNNKVDKVTGKSLILDTEITRLSTVVNQTLNSLGAEPAFSKNTAFNKNFGTGANDVARGNHTHSASDITSGTLNDNRIPNLSISKITSLATELASKAPLNNPEFAGVAKAPVFQAPKFNLGNNWTIEGENGEVVLKLSGIIKFRLTGDGFISVGGIAAYGASTGDGLSDDFLKKDSAETQTVNSKVVFANDVDFTDKDVTAHSLNVTNTAVVKDLETGTVKIGQTWSVVEDANGNLVFKKNGVIKHTING